MTGLAIAAAIASAFCYAVAAALQHREAGPSLSAGRTGLIRRLCRRPWWLAGIVAMCAGGILHIVALSIGPLPIVQPVGAASLVFALPLGARLHRRKLRTRDAWAAVAVAAGLTIFLTVMRVPPHVSHLSGAATGVLVGATAGGVGLCALWARQQQGARRAISLAVAAGIAFGASSALARGIGSHALAAGMPSVVSWPTLALVVIAPAGFIACQYAYRDGSLGAAMSTMTVADPLTAIVFAVALLGDTLHMGVAGGIGAIGAALLIIAGIVGLTASPNRAAVDEQGWPEPSPQVDDGRLAPAGIR